VAVLGPDEGPSTAREVQQLPSDDWRKKRKETEANEGRAYVRAYCDHLETNTKALGSEFGPRIPKPQSTPALTRPSNGRTHSNYYILSW
jgi:hypothetical protein